VEWVVVLNMGSDDQSERRSNVPWTEQRLRQIIHSACEAERAELADVVLWARSEIARQQRREKLWEKAKSTLLGHVLICITVGSGLAAYALFQAWVTKLKTGESP
jgi:hypothetical protein